MAMLPLRQVSERPVAGYARDWLEQMKSELADPKCDRALLCRRV